MILALAAGRIAVAVIAALGTLRLGAGVYFWRVTEALERPSYQVLALLKDGVEIRRYESYLIAETTVQDGVGFREPTRVGFQACASYIFGKNKRRANSSISSWFSTTPNVAEKMAMTAPVRVSGETPPTMNGGQRETSSTAMKKTKVSFVIGNKYSLKTAPKPLDASVKVRQVYPHTLAVRTFSGPPPKDQRVQKERARIEKSLAEAGRKVPGPDAETLVYGYHDPFITPNFLRRNEVAVVIDGTA